ncbi:MAG: glycoside hydrolase family 9 protein [Scrofimicrobium sp.]
MRIIVPHIGFSQGSRKSAVIADLPEGSTPTVSLLRPAEAEPILMGATPAIRVDSWFGNCFSVVDLSGQDGVGEYKLTACLEDGATATADFLIDQESLLKRGASDVLSAFKILRSSGEIDRKDRSAGLFGHPEKRSVDARGGWLDASGDFSKFLSHLTYTPTMSPQQIPLCAWAFLEARSQLNAHHPRFAAILDSKLRDEGLYGADFIHRFQSPEGYFYTGIFDGLTKDLNERLINAPLPDCVRCDRYQSSYRGGGGMAIAALARASIQEESGDFTRFEYLSAARKGFLHLEENNAKYLFALDLVTGELVGSTESIVDDYCALLAASELFAADPRPEYAEAAAHRMQSLVERYHRPGDGSPGWFVAWDDDRPWFSNVETGLPVVALLRFADVFGGVKAKSDIGELEALVVEARSLSITVMADVLRRTKSAPNPFGYARARMTNTGPLALRGTAPHDGFFVPHVNETGYWWQGENANLGSLSHAAARVASLESTPQKLKEDLREFATNQVEWIVGKNPFDACMLQGRGRGNPEYMVEYPNIPGGIVNGITAGLEDEQEIAFLTPELADSADSWRWAEQWIPHSAWYLLALSTVPGDVA